MNAASPVATEQVRQRIARERARRKIAEERRRRLVESADGQLAIRCRDHLETCIREAWPIVEPGTRYVGGRHIGVICAHLEAQSAGELPRLLINQPPRTMKSLTVAVFWPAWEWLRSPHLRWLFASYAASLSIRDSRKCRDLIESRGGRQRGTLFQRLGYKGVLELLCAMGEGGDWGLAGGDEPWDLVADQNAKSRYETTEAGFRVATSRKGMGTGEGGDRIVVDDPTSAEEALSDAKREETNRWWSGTMSTRFNNAQATATIVMQRLHEDDLSGYLLENGDGWHHLCLPAEYEPSHRFLTPRSFVLPEVTYLVEGDDGEPEEVTVPGGRELPGDWRTEPGELLEPIRLGRNKIDALTKELAGSAPGQLQQSPIASEGGMFRREAWARRWEPGFEIPLHLGWDRVFQSWDMRFGRSKRETSSYVVGQVWGVHGEDVYLLAQARGRFDFTQTLHVVRAMTAFRPDAFTKLVERKANGEAVMSALQTELGGFIPIDVRESKEARAAAISPRVASGNVVLPAATTIPCPAFYTDDRGARHALAPTTVQDFIEEAAQFPRGRHDDQVDAMSQAINWAKPRPRSPNGQREGRGERRRRGSSPLDGAIIGNPINARW